MADTPPPLPLNTRFEPQTGQLVEIAPGIGRVTAPNSGPYTFTGTNTFIVGSDRVAVIDPGPDDARHMTALRSAIAGRPVVAILVTHTHHDHSASAERMKAETNAPLWFGGPHRLSRPRHWFEVNMLAGDCDWRLTPDRVLHDGDVAEIDGIALTAITTPGHCANHLCFGVNGSDLLLSGDHIMGWNSTLVAVPDGSMADYMDSLRKVVALPKKTYVPAHGGPIEDGPAFARALLSHRELRNRQVVDGVAAGARTIEELRKKIYPLLAANLQMAAAMTLRAHVEYLADAGEIRMHRNAFGTTLSPA